MHKGFLKTAALLGSLTVCLGAFAAHSMKEKISDYALATFETGVRYQFYHVFALFLTGILYKEFRHKTTLWAGWLFITGIILFSGSLYFLAFIQAAVKPGYTWIGVITPFGGIAYICGWIMLLISFFKKSRSAAL